MSHAIQEHVLIVDDHGEIRELLDIWLTCEGYECCSAANSTETWELLEAKPFELMVCDILLPGESGIELLAQVRKAHPDIAVIMATAVNDRRIAIRALELGAFGYIVKPFEQNEVIICAANALERRRLRIASQEYEKRLEDEVRARTRDVREREKEIAMRLIAALEYHNEETVAHVRRVGLCAGALAEAIGWEPRQVEEIQVAGPMHDIGKIGVPVEILMKPGKLTSEEFEVVKQHSEIGGKILSGTQIPLLRMAADIAWGHHENWDGSGYPRGVAGEDIPQSARIIAIVDVFDALRERRPYRSPMSEEKALEIMTADREKKFDSRIFDCFLKILPQVRKIATENDQDGAAKD